MTEEMVNSGEARPDGAGFSPTRWSIVLGARTNALERGPALERLCSTYWLPIYSYHEYFMGDEGALKMSENPKYTKLYREARAPEWDGWVDKGLIARPGSGEGAPPAVKPWETPHPKLAGLSHNSSAVDVRESAELSAWDIPVTLDKAIHQPHLENFFDSIRGKATLHCPGEVAFATAVTVLRVNEAVAARKMLHFDPKDFIA